MDVVIVPATVTVNKADNTQNATWISATSCPMYIVAEYQEASSSVGTTPAGVSAYTRYTGDYKIRVTSVYPSGASQVPLARFTADGAGDISGTITDVREYLRTHAADTSVGLSGAATFSGQSTLYDHIHALGTGTPSTTNAHGQTLSDFGYVDTTATHRRDSHVNGIIVTAVGFATNSYLGSLNTGGPDEYISFYQPAGAALIINGQVVTGAIPLPLYSSTAGSGTGDYWVTVNAALGAAFVSTASITFNPLFPQVVSQSVLLGLANVNPAAQTIASFVDQRTFYVMAQPEIRADLIESGSAPSVALLQSSTLQDNLNRIRHQVGKALTGSGSMWSGSNPLTAGASSNASPYHNHYILGTIPCLHGKYQANGGSTLVRAMNTTYQNTTGLNMFIAIAAQINVTTSTGQAYVELLSGTTSTLTPGVLGDTLGITGMGVTDGTGVHNGTVSGIIPPLYYYRASASVDANSAAALLSWAEYY
jgi:hypothetical protein